jgi:hypothetical protein
MPFLEECTQQKLVSDGKFANGRSLGYPRGIPYPRFESETWNSTFKRDQKRVILMIYRTKLRSFGIVFLNDISRPQHKGINSAVLVRKRTIPTERPQPVGEVSANFS